MKKVKEIEKGRKWSSLTNKKQFNYQMEVRQIVVDDYRLVLEEYFGGKKNVK